MDVILTTWKDYRDLTAQQITRGQVSMMGSGMRVREGELSELLSIRTWRELLFCLDMEEISRENGAKELAASNLRELLKRHYEGGAPLAVPDRVPRKDEPGGAQPFHEEAGGRAYDGNRRYFVKRYLRLRGGASSD